MTHVHPAAAPSAKPRQEGKSPYVLLFIILIVAAIGTWVVPAGVFDKETRDGITFAVSGSLHAVEQSGARPLDIFVAVAKGLQTSAPIIFLILFTGGALAVLESTGAIHQVLKGIARSSRLNDFSIILIFALVFGVLGTTGVVVNAVIAFVPIGMLVARSIGLNPMFGVSLVYLTCAAGFNTAITNPATTGLTQRLAQLPLFSGMGLRGITSALFVVVCIVFLTLYARRCRRNGERRSVNPEEEATDAPATWRHWIILAFASVTLIAFIYGAMTAQWGETEMTAMFLFMAVGSGLLGRLSPSAIVNRFIGGCSGILQGALIVGMARAISIVLEHGNILDPIVGYLSELIAPLHPAMAAVGMHISAALMHFAISSGSGESTLLIPIYVPIGDMVGLTRQVTVQAVLLGEGIVNCVSPTSGILMGVLAVGGIPFGRWLKFVAPLIAVWAAICIITLVIGVEMNWGPF
ncbi:Na+/H+ antiporter NhaC family protein [Pseudomonas batumici]|uniref:YfcC family protein n=1 Tax=Pseudomonas batumici TaxID=226910 RepID=UPI0030CFED87